MKLLMLHCSEITTKTKLEENDIGRGWMVLVGASKNDNPKVIYGALREIVKSMRYTNEKNITLVPFPYFGDGNNSEVIEKFEKELNKVKYTVSRFKFEDCSDVLINVFGHRVSVAYREIKNEDVDDVLQKT